MPGAIRSVVWNEPTEPASTCRGTPAGGPTVYVVEPHGNALFADVPLPVEPIALLADTQPDRPSDDRGELLALAVGRRGWPAWTSTATPSAGGCRAC